MRKMTNKGKWMRSHMAKEGCPRLSPFPKYLNLSPSQKIKAKTISHLLFSLYNVHFDSHYIVTKRQYMRKLEQYTEKYDYSILQIFLEIMYFFAQYSYSCTLDNSTVVAILGSTITHSATHDTCYVLCISYYSPPLLLHFILTHLTIL